jgi:hypothetical protein
MQPIENRRSRNMNFIPTAHIPWFGHNQEDSLVFNKVLIKNRIGSKSQLN